MKKPARKPRVDAIPTFSEPAQLAACQGVPIRTFGYTHILSGAPDFVDDARAQTHNAEPLVKVAPKRSWEITRNQLGTTAPRMPRTVANDYLPLECIHLIDGDPTTCWSSKTQPQADVEPAWIRLDLPAERDLCRIVLLKRAPGPARCTDWTSMPLDQGAVEVGMGMPRELTIKLSRDGLNWATVFDGASGDTPERREFTCEFARQPAKQVWIVGRGLPRVENWLHAFSIAGVEVVDGAGANVALATRGVGVTVSSTQHSMGQTRDEHRWLWPIHADLGLKWVRIGYHDDPVNWHWVEKEKGKLAVDPEADAAITWLVERGIDIVMSLGFGNRLHTQADPARKLPQLWEWYYENPAPPTTPTALKAWARYVRFMARKYRDRIRVFEIWNEWNIPVYWGGKVNLDQYINLARTTIPILRKECPKARIMLGSFAGFRHGIAAWTADELAKQERECSLLGAVRALAGDVDVIGWHPFYQTDPDQPRFRTYADDVRAFTAWCRAQGFRGEFMASEWSFGANYPAPTPPNWWGDWTCSELVKAKLVAQLTVLHTALGVGSFFCETYSNYYPLDLTLLRRSFAADPISPQQPQAAYYALRNLATALDELEPADFGFQVNGAPADVQAYGMARKGERVVALWRAGRPADLDAGQPCEVVVDGACREATGYDPLNGTQHRLNMCRTGRRTSVAGVRVRDYPVLLRFRT